MFAMCFPTPKIPAAVCQNGVMDYVYHPVEPLAFRLTLAGPLETIGSVNVAAMAADMRRSFPAEPMAPGDYDWTGFHVGAHVGDSWSTTGGSTVNTVTGVASAPIYANPHGGIQVGYDTMLPSRLVLGVEADVSSGGTKIIHLTDASGASADQTTVFDGESVRGRFGYAFDNILLYGTGGWAWSSNQYIRTQLTGTLNLATAGTDEAVNTYLGGWTAGGGVALALAQNWNVFAEYRYIDYGASTVTLPFSLLSTTTMTKTSEIEAGVNYKFNWSALATRD
jgi:high affinity Mn2+ porin